MCKNWKINGAGKTSKEYERPADRRRRLGYEHDLQGSLTSTHLPIDRRTQLQ
jgi:YD repeat-containing protein